MTNTEASSSLDLGPAVGPSSSLEAARRAIAYEIWRLRAGRAKWWLPTAAVLLGLLHGLNAHWTPGARGASGGYPTVFVVDTFQMFAVSMQVPLVALFTFAVMMGSVTTEYSQRVARTTFLTLSSRRGAFGVKLAVSALATMAVALVAIVVAAAVMMVPAGRLFTEPEALASTGFWRPVGLYLVGVACWPLVTVGMAALTRSRVFTVLFMTLWPLVGERLAGLLLGLVTKSDQVGGWLPFAAFRAAIAAPGTDGSLTGSHLAPGVGATVFVLFTASVAIAGCAAYVRRDAP